ncbi:MAG: bifunctional DNA-formamidopyrimidine glycosylase/DNA-(apurinic or apyrimidinic site) lyase [Myxococcota bacterium]|jgi:formamidopyrimidine-DNA glycosylase|nr:bifunctional DNA-formamidopyrimidine glycosylase/DNA-(apurinic or apyrimidinic site) lyase [Myxococcota bacterium]
MPELPEVESVRRSLERAIVERRVEELWSSGLAMRRVPEPKALREALLQQRFLRPERRGKYLQLWLGSGDCLLVHLGMSGRLLVQDSSSELVAHTHLRLRLDDEQELRLIDPRRFGFYDLLPRGQHDPSLEALGLEPLAPDFGQRFVQVMRQRERPVRSLLLDQHVIAGLGNIYVAEALWRAKVHPRSMASSLSERRLRRLAKEIRAVLDDALAASGTTLRDYRSPDGLPGYFAVSLAVYGREGLPCTRCESGIQRVQDAGRSSFFCPHCQRS